MFLTIDYFLAFFCDTFELAWALRRFSTDDANADLTYRYFVDICVVGVIEGGIIEGL